MRGVVKALTTYLGFYLGLIALALSWRGASPAYAEETSLETSPLKIIQETTKQVIEVNKNFESKQSSREHHSKLREIIAVHFDFNEMAKRSLGSYWLKITDEEREEFVDVFSELLARTYLSRIDKIRSDIVSFNGEKIRQKKAIVKTIINYEGNSFPIDYKFINKKGHWLVYDVVIENIGLVANYRNEFAGIIRKEKFSGLLARLKKKIRDFNKPQKSVAHSPAQESPRASIGKKFLAQAVFIQQLCTPKDALVALGK
ncbi:MAG: ABC transporter substrate-binding protein [Candidatus Dadabacteria bacterium]|nr:MAG: ABC transporter substrate-binding protein [Candidatus Dadabacteria bacterium]